MTHLKARPIGVFDSGLGGLTVVKELAKQLPSEEIIYVGDTARVPYGTKSAQTIMRYSRQIAFFLLKKKVKAIIVACNTASAVALKSLQNLRIPVVGVIVPGAKAAIAASPNLRVGVIGTHATMGSHAYQKEILKKAPRAQVWEEACPLFVPLVEEGWLTHPITQAVAKEYLRPLLKKKIDTLVLGCTHYPLLKGVLRSVVGPRVQLIDSAEATARDVFDMLTESDLINAERKPGQVSLYVTDRPRSFARLANQFLGGIAHPTAELSLENF
jgi:glutamate racemase